MGNLTGALYVGLLDGLLGVAGMMTLHIVMKWIIPENSPAFAPVSWWMVMIVPKSFHDFC